MILSKRTTIISLILITLIGLGVLGYSFWLTTEQNKELKWNIQVNLKHSSANEPRDIQVLTPPTDTSDWLTYRNEKYGYEIKYPKTWKLNDKLLSNVSFEPIKNFTPPMFMHIAADQRNPKRLSIFDWWVRNGWLPARYKIQIGDIVGASNEKLDPEIYNNMVLIDFAKDDKIFEIEWFDNDTAIYKDVSEVKKEYQDKYKQFIQIISTFKFYR